METIPKKNSETIVSAIKEGIHSATNAYKKSTHGDSQSHKMLTRKMIMVVPKDASHKSQQWNRTR